MGVHNQLYMPNLYVTDLLPLVVQAQNELGPRRGFPNSSCVSNSAETKS